MARQSQRIKAEQQANQEVEERMTTALQDLLPKTGGEPKRRKRVITCTAEDIIRERDERGLSWAQVAANLDLGSPGAARKAYTDLTGRPHTDSQMQGRRAPRGSGVRVSGRKTFAVQWDDDSDQDEIETRLNGVWVEESGEPGSKSYTPGHWSGSTITVARRYGIEEVRVGHVMAFSFGKDGNKPLTVEIREGSNHCFRAFYVRDIKEVR